MKALLPATCLQLRARGFMPSSDEAFFRRDSKDSWLRYRQAQCMLPKALWRSTQKRSAHEAACCLSHRIPHSAPLLPPAGQPPQQFRSLCGHRLKLCLRLCGRRLPVRSSSTFTMNAPTGGIHVSLFFTAQERLHIFQKNVLSNKQTGMPAANARHTVLLRQIPFGITACC